MLESLIAENCDSIRRDSYCNLAALCTNVTGVINPIHHRTILLLCKTIYIAILLILTSADKLYIPFTSDVGPGKEFQYTASTINNINSSQEYHIYQYQLIALQCAVVLCAHLIQLKRFHTTDAQSNHLGC